MPTIPSVVNPATANIDVYGDRFRGDVVAVKVTGGDVAVDPAKLAAALDGVVPGFTASYRPPVS